MYCLRCGCDVKQPNVFCDPCLKKMEDTPVSPDAIVHLPEHPMPVSEKKPPKKKRSDADRVRKLRRFNLFLCAIILGLSTVCCLLAYQLLKAKDVKIPDIKIPRIHSYIVQETAPATIVVPEI